MRLKIYVTALVALAFLVFLCPPASAQINSKTKQDIELILQEKASRTPAQKKMDSRLLQASRERRGMKMVKGVDLAPANLKTESDGGVKVDIDGDITEEFLNKIKLLGAEVIYASPKYHTVRALIDPTVAEKIAELKEVRFIKPASIPRTVGTELPSQKKIDAKPAQITRTNTLVKTTKFYPFVKRPSVADRTQRVKEAVKKYLQEHNQFNPSVFGSGGVNSEGDRTHLADSARNKYGYAGQGIKIGVISDSYNALGAAPADVLRGELPGAGNPYGNTTPVTVVQDTTGQSDEGRAMLQIVHDLAPKAQLFFATAYRSAASFADNITALRNTYGCDIIIDDISYSDEPVFQDGIIAQAVNAVTASGALYFSSAGNEGSLAKNTSGVWEGDFNGTGNDTTLGSSIKSGKLHNFSTAVNPRYSDTILAAPASGYFNLNWSDPLGGSANDYDLFLLSPTGTVVGASTNIQDGTKDPYEVIGYNNSSLSNYRLVVFKTSSAAVRALHVNVFRGTLKVATTGQTIGHSSAANAYSVAAAPTSGAFNTAGSPTGPYPNAFSSASKVELFTSDGLRKIFYNADSTPVTPGNFLFGTNGGLVRQKPDITAADGVSTTLSSTSGLNPFYGTSAAAPHAGAIAALLKSANPALTPSQIRSILTSTAIDIEMPGIDNISGYGIVMPLQALQQVNPAGLPYINLGTTTFSESTFSNGNGNIEPGETGKLIVQLRNSSLQNATNVTATVTTSTAGVTIIQGTYNAGTINASSGSANTATPFTFGVSSSVPCGTIVTFYITVTFTGGAGSVGYTITTTVGGVLTLANISSTLGLAPPAGAGYTATSGQQTGRIARSNTISTCGSTKANPGLTTSTGSRQYDAYTFTNTSGSSKCITVTLNSNDPGNVYSVAYLGSFVPSNISTNYLADDGVIQAGTHTYSFNVAAGAVYVVVVHDINVMPGSNATYTLSVTSNACSTPPACPTITVNPATIAGGTTGTPYSQAFTASGGNSPYTYTLSGTSPVGLTFSGSTLSGTPAQGGTYNFTITATDATGCTGSRSYTLVIPGTSAVTVSPGSGNYGTLKDAFDAINAGTHTGNITVNINGSTTESAPAVLNASGTGSASYTSVLIHPTINGISVSGSITGSAVIELNDADNIIIDGSVTGATATGIGGDAGLRNLTVKNTSTTATAGAVIAVKYGTNGAQNVTIKNVIVLGQDPTQTLLGIHIGGNTIGSAATVNNNNIAVENCDIQKAFFGIYDGGTSAASPATGHIIRKNNLSSTGVNRIRRVGMFLVNQNGIQVTENKVGGIVGDEGADAIGIAAGIQNVSTTATTSGGIINSTISKNIVDGIASTSTVGFSASGIAIAGGTGINSIINNMVSGITAPSTDPDIVAGIFVAGVTGSSTNLFYNTVSLSGDRGAVANQIGSYGIAISGTDPVVTLKDNILTTTQTSAGGANAKSYALGMTTTTFTNLTSDYTDFFFAGANAAGFRSGSLGATGTDYATLAAWQSTTGKDAHSINVAPVFVSSTNLHLLANNNPGINNKGTPISSPSITTDIDGDTRDATPDIGADEVIDHSVQPPIVTSFNPTSGPLGTSVTISGSYFNATPSNNIVYFGAVKATVTTGSTTSLTVTVPAGTTYQNLSVLNTVNGLTGYSSEPFVTTFTNPFGTGIPANYYKPKVDFIAGTTPTSVAFGDVDGDGKADMVIANYSSNTVSVLRNISASGSISTSSFAAKVDFGTGSLPFSVAVNDVDGDGKKDIVVANNGSNNISVLRNTATSGTINATSFAAKVDFTTGNNPYFITIGDIDGDGKPELVTANSSPNSFSVLRNFTASGVINATSFAAKVDYAAGFSPQSVAIDDMDGDGKPEVITANNGSNSISVFRNTSASGTIDASSFAARVDFATSNGPREVAVGDIDGDGKPDVAVTNQNGGSVSVFRNVSASGTITSSSLAAKVDFSVGSASTAIAIGDLDGDGKPDLAVANQSSNNFSLLRNTSTSGSITASSFAARVNFTTGTGPSSVAIGDLDGDGKAEVAIANQNTNPGTISVFQISAPATTSTDYFRTRQTGNWSNVNTWESATDAGFTTGVLSPATISPDFNANTITVRHNVIITASVKTDQTVINAGDTVFVDPNVILTLNDGTATDLTINGNLTIRSAAAGTGAIGNSTTATVTGNVIVERYIPSRRAWRLLTTPLSNTNTIYQEWQNGGLYTVGTGTFVTGPGGGNGLDNGNNYSLKSYNLTSQLLENVTNSNVGLSGVSLSAANKGYFMFVRGDRNPANLTPPNTNITTLKSLGSLQTGTQSFTASTIAGQFTLVGNPYASPVDFSLLTRTNIPKRFYAWDPALNTVGGYVLLDDIDDNGIYSISPSSTLTNILQSSQAFFIQTAAAGAASLVFNESNKSVLSTNAGFRTNDGTNEVFRANLYLKNSDNTTTLADGVLAEYNNNYSPEVNIEDGGKMSNINESLAIQRTQHLLSIERRPLIDGYDTLYLNLTNTTAREYRLAFEPANFSPIVSAMLEDTYLNTSTPVSVIAAGFADFAITSNTASAAPNRFRIVFRTSTALALQNINVKAYQKNAGVQVEWNILSEANTKNYEVEKSADGRTFTQAATVTARANNNAAVSYNWFDASPLNDVNYYRIRSIENSGANNVSAVVSVKIGSAKGEIVVYPNPATGSTIGLQFTNKPKGTYVLQLFNALGQRMLTKTIKHTGGSATQTIQLSSVVVKGVYLVNVSNGDDRVNQQVIIE